MNKKIENLSRTIFGQHHRTEQKNEELYNRKYNRINYEYLQLPKGWFKGKKALDACSGTALTNTHRLLDLGAEVTAIDLPGEIEFYESRIKPFHEGKYTLVRGSVLELPFENETFDYVHCEGALHHTTNPEKGFQELARVCKKGGYVYISVFGSSGIFRICEDALREEYKTGKHTESLGISLKEWVDTLDKKKLKEIIKYLNNNREGEDRMQPKLPYKWFDEDLVVSIKDRIQAPIYTRHSDEEIKEWFKKAGFQEYKRITRYPTGCTNIRRIFNPIYKNYEHPISKFLNGNGFPQWIGRK